MNKYQSLLDQLNYASELLQEIRSVQNLHCFEDGVCQLCPYNISLDDIIPIGNKARVCLFSLQNAVILRMKTRLRLLEELNSGCNF